jgi:ribosomal protein L29
MAKKEDINLKNVAELKTLLEDKRKKLQTSLFEKRLGKLKNTNNLRIMRHDIARLLTALNNKLKNTH